MIRLILLTGVSGAGKSTVLHALEEHGYRLVENVPVPALPAVVESFRLDQATYAKTVLIVTIDQATMALKTLKEQEDVNVSLMALDCEHDALLSRFRLTRHVHPLQSQGFSLEEALLADAETMKSVRPLADLYVDTTGMDASILREVAVNNLEGERESRLVVRFTSFGYKYGVPKDAEVVFDCRQVPNPYWVKELRPLTGLDQDIITWLEEHKETEDAFMAMKAYLDYFLEKAQKDKRNYVSINFGCSGGQHRSVYFAQRLYEHYASLYRTFVTHREIVRYSKK